MRQSVLSWSGRAVALALALAFAAWGPASGAQGVSQAPIIDKIEVLSTGHGPPPKMLVRDNMTSIPGRPFSGKRLAEDIKRLYRTGFFSDVATEVVQKSPGHVILRVKVVPKPVVRKIIIQGNHHFSKSRLKKLCKHGEGVVLNDEQMAKDAEAIRKRYRDSGYTHVNVDVVVQPIPNTDEVNLVFKIREGTRYKIRHVEFIGNHRFSRRKLLKTIRSKPTFWSYFFRTGYFDEDKLAHDLDMLRLLYTSKGYLDFRVAKVERIPNRRGTTLRLIFHLTEGKPYTVRAVEIVGAKRFSPQELMKRVKLKPGMVFDSSVEQADIRAIRAKYDAYGYLDFACYPQHLTNSADHTVAVRYRIHEGQPCRIRDIYIRGNHVTQDRVIRRELAILPGDLGNGAKIRASKQRLMNLNYFKKVDIVPLTTTKENERDLLVTVKEKPTGSLSLGAGFSTQDALLGTIDLTQANFDWRNWPHFTGAGQRLRLRLQAGTRRNDAVLSFTEPWLYGRRLRLDLTAFANDRDQDQYTETRIGAGGRLTRPWPGLRYWRQYVGLRVQGVKLTDFGDGDSAELKKEEGRYTANVLSIGVIRDTRNRYINPSSGSRLSLGLDFEPKFLGSYSSVYRLGASGTVYFPLPKDCVFKINAEIGMLDSIGGDDPAIFDRYFAGGSYSIRGFRYREVGPVDIHEDPVGGKSLLRGTFEFIFPIYERILGSVFSDYGNVWRGSTDWDPTELNVTVGLGIQINLPIGPVRLDYGYPIITDEANLKDNGGRFHFNLGYTF